MSTFQKLFSESVAFSIAKQQALGKYLGEHTWNVNLEKGIVDFDEGRIFPIQLLGSESESEGTWLWAWANTQSDIPPALLSDANKLRSIGEKQQIDFFTNAEVPLSEVSGHEIGLLASGLCEADCYYHGSRDGGAVVFLIYETPLAKIPELMPQQVAMVLASVIQNFVTDNRLMVASFFKSLGHAVEENETSITGKLSGETDLVVEFDELERIIRIETVVNPTKQEG